MFHRLPSRPLADAMLAEGRRLVAGNLWDDIEHPGPDGLREAICARAGVNARVLYGWERGERPTVQFDIADRVLVNLDLLWFEVWTDDDPAGYQTALEAFEGTDATEASAA